jgi:hypothetical protein
VEKTIRRRTEFIPLLIRRRTEFLPLLRSVRARKAIIGEKRKEFRSTSWLNQVVFSLYRFGGAAGE